MSSSIFEIKEHALECQHIREYARATANSQEDVLQLAIKQYIPLDNREPQAGDITIIGTTANGFPKVCYIKRCAELILIGFRNCMNRSGKISTDVQKPMVSGYVVSG